MGHLQGETEVKVETKVQTLGPSLFHKNSNPSKSFQLMFYSAGLLPLVRVWHNLTVYWEVRAQKPPKMGHFMDAELVRETLKMFYLTIANANILMKLTTIMYLHEIFNLTKNLAATHRV